jgi:hypothetical protein
MKETEYKISKDKVKNFVEINDILDFDIEGYESPINMITKQIATDIAKKTDDTVLRAIWDTGVNVNKDELIKALSYDRDQYKKGYTAGYEAAFRKLPWWARKILLRRMGRR